MSKNKNEWLSNWKVFEIVEYSQIYYMLDLKNILDVQYHSIP